MTDMIWTFSAWMTCLLVTPLTNVWGRLAEGRLVALVVFGRALLRHKVHMLDVASVAYFAGRAAVRAIVHPGDLDT
jgi:hypothetical protein